MLNIYVFPEFSTSTVIWAIFIATFFIYGIWPYTYLKKYGIPGPLPLPFIGNLPLLALKGVPMSAQYLSQRFGRMAGYYIGRYPAVVVSDLDMIQKILIKDFSTFSNRYHLLPPNGIFLNSIFFAKDNHWKSMRSILSPTFSGGQLKEIVPLIQKVINNTKENLSKFVDSNEAFEALTIFSRFTLDVIATTAFGIEIDSQKNPNCPVVRNCINFVQFDLYKSLIPLSFICRPLWYLADYLHLPGTLQKKLDYLISFCQDTIKFRKNDKTSNRRDMMQLMLEAQVNAKKVIEEYDDTTFDNIPNHKGKQTLTDNEIISQVMTFLLAGYETTSSTFNFLVHSLAFNQDIQDKVYDEIINVIGQALPDHDNVRELPYLDMCISETLRKYPILTRLNREAKHDVNLGEWTIPSNTDIVIPIYTIHNSPEYWPNPEKFIPERFTPEAKASRHPFAYLPFGKGPRICIGMKLAQMELKMLAVSLIREFKFVPCSKTENPIQLSNLLLLRAQNGIWLNVERRERKK